MNLDGRYCVTRKLRSVTVLHWHRRLDPTKGLAHGFLVGSFKGAHSFLSEPTVLVFCSDFQFGELKNGLTKKKWCADLDTPFLVTMVFCRVVLLRTLQFIYSLQTLLLSPRDSTLRIVIASHREFREGHNFFPVSPLLLVSLPSLLKREDFFS